MTLSFSRLSPALGVEALPSRNAWLYARVVPEEGGQTGWVDTAAVYDALPESTK